MSLSVYSVRGTSLVVNQHVLRIRFSLVSLTVRKIILISHAFVKAFEPVSVFLALNNSIVMENTAAEWKTDIQPTTRFIEWLNRGSGNGHVTAHEEVHGPTFHNLP